MKKLGKVMFSILEVIIVLYVIFITACLLCKNKFGYTVFGEKTVIAVDDSNSADLTEFKNGDLLLIQGVKYNDVNVGDEIYYYDTLNNSYIIKIAKVEKKQGEGNSAIYIMENSTSIASERIIGKFDKNVKSLGSVYKILTSRLGFLLLVLLPVFVLFIYNIYKMVILLKFDTKAEENKIEEKTEVIEEKK